MTRYQLLGTVQRTVYQDIYIVVDADNYEEACEKAERVMLEYPTGHDIAGVPICAVENQEYEDSIVLDLDTVESYRDEKN